MNHFRAIGTQLFYSFPIQVEEQCKLDAYLDLLESSGVWNYLSSVEKVDSQNGRPSYDPYALFAVILLGFSIGQASLREIETSCKMTFVSFMWPVVYTPVMLLFRASSKKLSHHRKRKFLLAFVKKFSINAAFK